MWAFRNKNYKGLVRSQRLATWTLLLVGALSTPLFGQAEKHKAYGVLIDNTLSLEKQFPQVIAIGSQAVNRVRDQGTVSLFSFKPTRDESYYAIRYETEHYEGGSSARAVGVMGVDWTQDASVLTRYVDSLTIVKGHTDLFGAIRMIGEALNVKAGTSENANLDKIIILITDGEHRMEQIGISQPTETDDERRKRARRLRTFLKDSGIRVYVVGITGDLDTGNIYYESPRLRAENFLTSITRETGGRVVFSRSRKPKIDALVNQLLSP